MTDKATENSQSPQPLGLGSTEGLGVCRLLPPTLARENGGGYGFVCIWRMPRDGSDSARRCNVAEFLSQQENRGGSWYIDGGWGGHPGPIRVDWDKEAQAWRNRGFPPHARRRPTQS